MPLWSWVTFKITFKFKIKDSIGHNVFSSYEWLSQPNCSYKSPQDFSMFVINNNLLQIPFIYYTQGLTYIIQKGCRSLNIHRLKVTVFDLYFNVMHPSISPWCSQHLQGDNRLFHFYRCILVDKLHVISRCGEMHCSLT